MVKYEITGIKDGKEKLLASTEMEQEKLNETTNDRT
jgi:hypothetical protein